MPLVPRDGGPRERIEITAEIDAENAGDWYEIKTMLGYYDALQASDARSMSFKVPAGRLTRGEIDLNQLVTVTPENVADAAHFKLAIYLTAWSHAEPISSLTIKRIPPKSSDAILKRIAEVEQRQVGPSRHSPLDGSSNDSSATPSSTDGSTETIQAG